LVGVAPHPYDVAMAVGARPLVPSRLAPGGVVHGSLRHPTTQLAGYVALMKLRVVELLLMTTVPTMVLAEQGWPSTWLVLVTLVGGTLAAGGANTINMVIDRDIDALMTRTQGRPLVTGLITPGAAMRFAIGLEVVAFVVLWAGTNLLAACFAIGATLFYVFVYTIWLKRTSRQNVVIGGAAGAAPILVGWAAVTNSVSWAALLLFVVIFLWTPPHTWALAIRHADDYRAANVPMLPAVASMTETTHRMVEYTAALVIVSLALVPVADLGWIYGITAGAAGALFLWGAIDLGRRPTLARSMRLFAFSITYITLLFGAMTLDVLVRHGV
jgi:protoheme IX farnesyltransferase